MLFEKFQDLLPYFGFQTRFYPSEDVFRSGLAAEEPYAVIEGSGLSWRIPDSKVKALTEEIQSYHFRLPAFQPREASPQGFKTFHLELSFSQYEEISAVIEFLMSGFVRGFLVAESGYLFNPAVYRFISALHETEGHSDNDLKALVSEQARFPDDAILHNYAGKIAVQLGDKLSAARYFADAAQSCPHYAEAYSNLGTLMWDVDQKEKAFGLFSEALLRCPFNPNLQDNFINTGVEIGHIHEMKVTLEKIERFFPEYPALFYLKALVSYRLGMLDDCKDALGRLLSYDPEDIKAKELWDEVSATTPS